jgi:hypothetical protein
MVDSTEGKIPPMAQFLRKANLRYSGGIAMRTEWAATSVLYQAKLADWSRHTFEFPNNAASGSSKRVTTEIVWCNF